MLQHISLQLPISPNDLKSIEEIVWTNAILVPGNFRCDNDFGVLDHHFASARDGLTFHALFDRNLISPLITLARGETIPLHSAKVAAASAAFCILADILIEPSIALYEYASTLGAEASKAELPAFRIADNIDPQFYVDIALGRTNRIPQHEIDAKSAARLKAENDDNAEFSTQLRYWKLHYFQALKIVSLVRDCASPQRAAIEFIEWQLNESFFDSVASMYGLAAISHRPPKGGMIDALRSENRRKLAQGLRRATWDIYVINHFGRLCRRSDQLWSLWSQDQALVDVAKWVIVEDGVDTADWLNRYFLGMWGPQDGARIANAYVAAQASLARKGNARARELQTVFEAIDEHIARLECILSLDATS